MNARLTTRPAHVGTFLVALTTLIGSVGLTACNTVRGIGKDTEAAGEAIQEEADQRPDAEEKTDDDREVSP